LNDHHLCAHGANGNEETDECKVRQDPRAFGGNPAKTVGGLFIPDLRCGSQRETSGITQSTNLIDAGTCGDVESVTHAEEKRIMFVGPRKSESVFDATFA
jgi:hypothetical protein